MAERDYDAVVVGAGPAGSCAATVLARAGRSVLLLERGPFAGSKNMYGGVVYPRILDGLHPQWWEEAPIQRWVTRRSTMVLTETQALTIDFRTAGVGAAAVQRGDGVPSRLRPLAGRQGRGRRRRPADVHDRRRAAARSRRRGDRRAHRPARRRHPRRRRHRLRRRQQLLRQGSRALRADRRRPLHARREGVDRPAQGGHRRALQRPRPRRRRHRDHRRHRRRQRRRVPLHEPRHARRRRRAEAAEAGRPAAAPGGADRRRQGAPGDRPARRGRRDQGVLGARDPRGRAGDDAADDGRRDARRRRRRGAVPGRRDLAGGRQLRHGQRHRRRRGDARGARGRRHVTRAGLAGYERRLGATFVLRDHRKLRRAPELVLSDRVQHLYPQLVAGVVEGMFRVDNPHPKPGLRKLLSARAQAPRHPLARPGPRRARPAWRTFG